MASVRVVVDALAARTGGGLTYLRSLLPSALAADDELELVVVAARGDVITPAARLTVVEAPALAALPRRLAWERTRLAAVARELRADLLFAPSELAPDTGSLPLLVGLQNPNLFAPPDTRTPLRQRARIRALVAAARLSVRRADALVFVSEAFRRIAEPLLPATSAVRHTVTVGVDARFSPGGGAGRFAELRPYVLCVSDVYPYKSLPLAVDAFATIAADDPSLRLVLAGRPQDVRESRRIGAAIERHGLADRVVRLDAVPHEEMPDLYRGASCFLFPSTLESLGLPPLEALACGVPVVAARASVMPEVRGEAAAFFSPGDARAAAAAVATALREGRAGDERARREVLARHDPRATGAALAAVFRSSARH